MGGRKAVLFPLCLAISTHASVRAPRRGWRTWPSRGCGEKRQDCALVVFGPTRSDQLEGTENLCSSTKLRIQ